MEIRMLKIEEVPRAVQLSRYVYATCIEPGIVRPELTAFFDEYMNPENLMEQVRNRKLFLWGRFDRARRNMPEFLSGVCAMTSEGLITMLYVHPRFQLTKTGRKLLMIMRQFAACELNLKEIYVNATPASAVEYFCKFGFSELDPNRENTEALSVPLSAKTIYLKDYPRKTIPGPLMTGISVLTVLVAFTMGIVFCLQY